MLLERNPRLVVPYILGSMVSGALVGIVGNLPAIVVVSIAMLLYTIWTWLGVERGYGREMTIFFASLRSFVALAGLGALWFAFWLAH